MQPAITSCTFRAGPKKADELFTYQKFHWCDFFRPFFVIFSATSLVRSQRCVQKGDFFVFLRLQLPKMCSERQNLIRVGWLGIDN